MLEPNNDGRDRAPRYPAGNQVATDGGAHRTTTHRIEISYRTILAIVLTVAGLWLLELLLPILVVLVTSLMLVGTLSPYVAAVQRGGLRRPLAIAVVVGLGAALMVVLALMTVPALVDQVTNAVNNLPTMQKQLGLLLSARHVTTPLADVVRSFKPEKTLQSFNLASAYAASLGVFEVLGYAATAVVLAIYFMADGERARGTLYALFPRRFHVRLARVLLNLETIVGGYLRGQIITSVAIGIFTFALLSVTRVPNAVALAAFAALTDVIPFVGGLLATTPAVLVALSRSAGVALIVLLAMIAYQEFESRIIVPRVYGRTLRLSSATVVIALLVGGRLGGIVGALLALPMAAGVRMLIEELRVELPGDDTDVSKLRARDARAERAYERESAGASPVEAATVALEIATKIRESDAQAGKNPESAPLSAGK